MHRSLDVEHQTCFRHADGKCPTRLQDLTGLGLRLKEAKCFLNIPYGKPDCVIEQEGREYFYIDPFTSLKVRHPGPVGSNLTVDRIAFRHPKNASKATIRQSSQSRILINSCAQNINNFASEGLFGKLHDLCQCYLCGASTKEMKKDPDVYRAHVRKCRENLNMALAFFFACSTFGRDIQAPANLS